MIALLTLRINPYDQLFPLLEKEHLGATGETYAFDKDGLMLSRSRFENQLKELHLLEKLTTKNHAIHLYNPGINLLENPEAAENIKPVLTEMAASATNGASGKNFEGYLDYRGVEVVGTWHWFPEVDIGITTEQDLADAFSTFYFTRNLVIFISGLGCVLIILLFVITAIKQKKVRASEAYLDAIYKTSVYALIIFDEDGTIQKCNPTTEQLFGHDATDLIGQNIRILMPSPDRSPYDTYLDNYKKFGRVTPETSDLNTMREYSALKADGSIFPVELNVHPLHLPEGTVSTSSLRDISKRKQAEIQAKEHEQHLMNTLKHAQVGTWHWSKENRSVSYTGNTAYIYGLEPEGITEICMREGFDFIQNVHPSDRDKVKNAVKLASRFENQFDIEYRVIWPDDNIHWVNARGDVIFDKQGIPTHTMGIVQDITQRKELEQELRDSEQALRESENHLSNILDTAPVNIYIKNLEGKYIFVNPAWKESVSLSSQEVLGRDDFDLFGEEIAKLHDNTQQMALTNKQAISFEEEFTTKDGQTKSFMTSLFPLQNIHGEAYAIGGWSAEITGLKQTQHDLELARQEADASNHAKSAFLATMSHEIRTPMNGVVGIVDVLKHSPLDNEQEKLVKTISDSSFALLGIIDDILDFSKIDAGKMELEQIPISMEEILDGVGETLLPLAAKKDIELITFCDPALPDFYGDPTRIRQILYNISGNAIKFTNSNNDKRGRVIMRCECPRASGEMNTLIIRVEDNGIGMPSDVQKRLFQPFSQAESSTTREFGGTGLGLTISKRLSEMMGGDIAVQSQAGEGTIFTVSLPLTPVRINTESDKSTLNDLPVLFFNGDEVIDNILQRYLIAEGVSLLDPSCTEPSELASSNEKPILITLIVDTHNNSDHTKKIQEQVRQQYSHKTRLRFILINQGVRRKARPMHEDTLQLDINSLGRSILLNAVSDVISLEGPILDTKGNLLEPAIENMKQTETPKNTELLFLIAEDNPVNQRVINHQLNILGYAAETADDGQEAFEMWQQGNGKYNLILTDCHMPKMDGYALAQAVREQEAQQGSTSHIPIIAITADAMKGTRQACLDAGMDDYITKPLQMSVLTEKLNEWLPRIEEYLGETDTGAPDTMAQDQDQETAEEAQIIINPDTLPELLQSDDPSLLTDFYHDFVTSAHEIIQDICDAMKEDNLEKISAEAHKLKSSSYTIGANTLADCCLLLETSGRLGEGNVIRENIESLKSYLEQAKEWITEHFPK